MAGEILFAIALINSDFPICTAYEFQDFPVVEHADSLFYVFWVDRRFYFVDESFAICAARVTPDGQVMDPDGKVVFRDSTADRIDVAYDGSNFFVVARNRC